MKDFIAAETADFSNEFGTPSGPLGDLMKTWERKLARKTAQAGSLGFVAVTLAACQSGGDSAEILGDDTTPVDTSAQSAQGGGSNGGAANGGGNGGAQTLLLNSGGGNGGNGGNGGTTSSSTLLAPPNPPGGEPNGPIVGLVPGGENIFNFAPDFAPDAFNDLMGDITEDSAPFTANGQLLFSDPSFIEFHVATATFDGTTSPLGIQIGELAVNPVANFQFLDWDSAVNWGFSADNAELQFLAEGQTFDETYTVKVIDSLLNFDTTTVTITFTGVNDPVVVEAADTDGAVTEDTDVNGNGKIKDSGEIEFSDVDLIDTHTANAKFLSTDDTIVGDQIGKMNAKILQDTVDGVDGVAQWTFKADNADTQFLGRDDVVTETYRVRIKDGEGGDADTEVQVTITGVNDAPEFDDDNDAATALMAAPTAEDTPDDAAVTLDSSVDAGFTDPDFTDDGLHTASPPTFVESNATDPNTQIGTAVAAVSIDTVQGQGGVVTVDHSIGNAAVQYLGVGDTFEETYSVMVSDGLEDDEVFVKFVIEGVNDDPEVVANPANKTTKGLSEDQDPTTLTKTFKIDFSDVDLSDSGNHTASAAFTGSEADLGGIAMADVTTDTDPGTGTGGQVTVGYELDAAAAQFLAEGENLAQTYTITIEDDHGGSATQDITINLRGKNDAPESDGGTLDKNMQEDSPANGGGANAGFVVRSGTLNFSDVDLLDTGTHTVSVVGAGTSTVAGGVPLGEIAPSTSVITPTDGTGENGEVRWTYRIDPADVPQSLAQGETIVETFTLEVTDGGGLSFQEDVSVTINGNNDDPEVTGVDKASKNLNEDKVPDGDGNIGKTGTIDFADVDLSDSGTHTASAAFTGAGTELGTLVPTVTTDTDGTGENGQVTWEYEVASADVQFLADGEDLDQTYTVTIEDGFGGTATQDIAVVLKGKNDDPVNEGGPTTKELDEDSPDNGVGVNSGFIVRAGILDFSDVDIADSGTHTVSVQSTTTTDGGGTLFGVFEPVVRTDTDANGENGELRWVYKIAPADMPDLGAGDTITESAVIRLEDGAGGFFEETVEVTINGVGPVNSDPVNEGGTTDRTLDEDATANGGGINTGLVVRSGNLDFLDVDLGDSGNHTGSVVSVVTTDAGGTPLGNFSTSITSDTNPGTGDDGVFRWIYTIDPADLPQSLALGESIVETAVVRLEDGAGGFFEETVTATIEGVNDDPESQGGTLDRTFSEDDAPNGGGPNTGFFVRSGTIDFIDVDLSDSGTHTVSIVGESSTVAGGVPVGELVPANTKILTDTDANGENGEVRWFYRVDADDVQFLGDGETLVETFTLRVEDGNGGFFEEDVSVTVNGVNDLPEAVDDVAVNPGSNTFMLIDVLANDSDAETAAGDLILTAPGFGDPGGPTGGSVLVSGTQIGYQPFATFNGIDTFTYTIEDEDGATATASVTVAVNDLVIDSVPQDATVVGETFTFQLDIPGGAAALDDFDIVGALLQLTVDGALANTATKFVTVEVEGTVVGTFDKDTDDFTGPGQNQIIQLDGEDVLAAVTAGDLSDGQIEVSVELSASIGTTYTPVGGAPAFVDGTTSADVDMVLTYDIA